MMMHDDANDDDDEIHSDPTKTSNYCDLDFLGSRKEAGPFVRSFSVAVAG